MRWVGLEAIEMGIVLCEKIENAAMDMRDAYCGTLVELAKHDDRITLLDADLMGAMGTKPFAKAFPEQTVDCGIQEANMVGVACGMSAVGKIPFAHTFAPFMSRRACDQIFMSAAYAKMNVKLIGSDPGITAQLNGGTHMPFEDMGIMRLIPTVTVVEPTDVTMLQNLLPKIAANYGVYYMRLVRKSVKAIYAPGSDFTIGKAVTIQDGSDATIIASGFCVAEAIAAAEELETEGIHVRVLDMFTWKPMDEAAVLLAAEQTGAIVTAENHNVINGLGCAVAQVLAGRRPTPVEMVGVQDQFGEVGKLDYLAERFGLKSHNIVEAVHRALERK